MAKYIELDALVAEIEKIIADETESIKSFEHNKNASEVQRSNARIGVLTHLRSLLETIEVKEVDLENIAAVEWDDYIRKIDGEQDTAYMLIKRNEYIELAKHFFELGLDASNPLTWEDIESIHTLMAHQEVAPILWKCVNEAFYQEVLKRFKETKEK